MSNGWVRERLLVQTQIGGSMGHTIMTLSCGFS